MKDDHLLDRDCVILDGHCDCPRNPKGGLPFCRKYGTLNALEEKKNVPARKPSEQSS